MLEQLTGWEWVFFIALLILFFFSSLIFLVIFLYKRAWPESYVVLEDIRGNGRFEIVRKGKCKKIRFGDGGEEIYYLQGIKKKKAAYGKRIGRNQIGWVIGQDGLWYNFDFGDFNSKLKEMGLNPAEKTIRYANVVIRKGLDEKYLDKTFFEKWFLPITLGMFFLIMVGFVGTMWYTGNQNLKITAANAASMDTAKEILETTKEVIARLDTINVGGSGIKNG